MASDKLAITGAVMGKRIKQYRTMAGFTQKDLASKCRCSQEQIARWEAGKFIPDKANLHRLSIALKIDYQILTVQDPSFITEDQVMKMYAKLSQPNQVLIHDLIKALIG